MTSAENGVVFDVDGNGNVEQVSWTAPGAGLAFLAIDRDGDGAITSGRELFGNHTLPDAKNGFEALSMMARETNGGVLRGSVSEEDPLYEKLLLWTDGNHNGISEPEEWRPARDLFSDIGVGYRRCPGGRDESGNLFLYRGWAHIRIGCGADLERCGPALLTSEAVAGASGAEPRKRSCL